MPRVTLYAITSQVLFVAWHVSFQSAGVDLPKARRLRSSTNERADPQRRRKTPASAPHALRPKLSAVPSPVAVRTVVGSSNSERAVGVADVGRTTPRLYRRGEYVFRSSIALERFIALTTCTRSSA